MDNNETITILEMKVTALEEKLRSLEELTKLRLDLAVSKNAETLSKMATTESNLDLVKSNMEFFVKNKDNIYNTIMLVSQLNPAVSSIGISMNALLNVLIENKIVTTEQLVAEATKISEEYRRSQTEVKETINDQGNSQ